MMIIPRVFKPFIPKYVMAFDTETWFNESEKKQNFILGTLIIYEKETGKEYQYVFDDRKKLNDFLLSYNFVGHKSFNTAFNLSFDLYMLPLVYSKNFNDYSKGSVYIAKYIHTKRHKQVTRFIDMANFFTIKEHSDTRYNSLSNVAKMFNREKMKKPDYLGKRKPKNKTEYNYLVKYCMEDSKICLESAKWILSQFQEFETGVCVTPSQFAFRVFQSKFLKQTIHTNPIQEQLEIFRDGYKGGRTEAFKLGTIEHNKIRSYDFNSFYVFSMVDTLLPITAYKKIINPSKSDIRKIEDNNICCYANISTKIKNDYVGILPIRQNSLVFPNGHLHTNLYTSELSMLDDLKNYSINTLYIANGDYVLRDYGNWAWKNRNLNRMNELLNLLYKLFGNSVYGKFAQINEFYERMKKFDYLLESGVNSISISIDEILHTLKFYYNKAFEKTLKPTKLLSIPISAEISSKCRKVLTDNLIKYQDNLLYCDTDSFMLGDVKINESKKLGGLKLEVEGNKVVILKEKIYQVYKDNELVKVTTKGFPKKAIVANNQIVLQYDNQLCNRFTVTYNSLLKPKTAWIQFKQPYVPTQITKSFNLEYNTKRKLLSKDFSRQIDTIPLII